MTPKKLSKMAVLAGKCLQKAVREELRRKAALGQYVIINRNGKTCRVSARQAIKIAKAR